MASWLVKSEPEVWPWKSHAAAGADAWTGVRNHQAKLNLAKMRRGEKVFFYHSGGEKAVVGVSEVAREAYPDPTDAKAVFVAVDLKAVRPLARPVSLAEIKADPRLREMALVKNSRLSVQPVAAEEMARIEALART
ncbi:MAG: EVE domain-containing protein [Caulobacteraceae bacterium]